MKQFRCDCGDNSGHTNSRQCEANRHATAVMMARQHQPKLREVRGPDGKFVRFPEGDEYGLPTGAAVPGGIIVQP